MLVAYGKLDAFGGVWNQRHIPDIVHTMGSILLAPAAEDGCRFSDTVEYCGKSPPTVSLCLKGLIKDGLVTKCKLGFTKIYYSTCRSEVDKLVELYRQRPSDRPISGFEDIINSL